ncbi:MAG: YybH family protein [Thermodesulfobacteriota bacterium]
MEEKIKNIKKINEQFYEAICTANLSMMEELWVKTDDAKCVHPGWPIIFGWEKIRESWETIFNSGGLADIGISNIYVEIIGSSAWLNCTERLSYIIDNQVIVTMAQTTNIFELNNTDWQLVLHHASPMPIPQSELSTETIQ